MSEPIALALREQYSTVEQQRDTATIGMWVFLITEIMLFGALFTAYMVYRMSSPQAFDIGSAHMESTLGAINTLVLLTSSFTMALAVWSAETGNQRMLSLYLILTMIIGAAFLVIKFTEYYLHYQDHTVPGVWFQFQGPLARHVEMFFVFYFVMTCLHAIHMTIGLGVLSVLLFRNWVGSFSADYHTAVDLGGLYWHFIDIVWLFLYAIFYIPGLHLK